MDFVRSREFGMDAFVVSQLGNLAACARLCELLRGQHELAELGRPRGGWVQSCWQLLHLLVRQRQQRLAPAFGQALPV